MVHVPGSPLESSSPKLDGQTQDSTGADPTLEVTYVPVYTFAVYDHDKGAPLIYPKMATRQTIVNMRGKVNEDTALVIDASLLDVFGFYTP